MSEILEAQRQLAAVLAADVVGFSALMAKDQTATIFAIGKLRREILEPQIDGAGGIVIKRMGDGWLAHFPSVSAAANCALNVQRMLNDDGGLELRIGIH
ncbi:MAG: adenylate cyclase, partial [Boseongicola sp.]